MSTKIKPWSTFLRDQLQKVTGKKHRTIEEVDLLFRRKTNRYGPKGSVTTNKGYLTVARNRTTGRFESVE